MKHNNGSGHHVDGGHQSLRQYAKDGDGDDDSDSDSQNITHALARNEALLVSIVQLEEEKVKLQEMLEQHKIGCQSEPQRCRHAPDTAKQPAYQAREDSARDIHREMPQDAGIRLIDRVQYYSVG